MGWGSGSTLMDLIIDAVKQNVPDKDTRKRIYEPIYQQMTSSDWDTQDECVGKDEAFDEIYHADMVEQYGEGWDEDDEE